MTKVYQAAGGAPPGAGGFPGGAGGFPGGAQGGSTGPASGPQVDEVDWSVYHYFLLFSWNYLCLFLHIDPNFKMI